MISEFIRSVFVLAAVAIAATWFASRLNRERLLREEKARAVIRKRLCRGASQQTLESFLLSCNMSVEEQSKAKRLLDEIGRTLKVPIEALIFDCKLRDALRVSISDLEIQKDRSEELDEKYIEPFTYDVLYVLENISDKKAWSERWRATPELPHNEEELADFVMEMSPSELLRFFSPLVSQRIKRD